MSAASTPKRNAQTTSIGEPSHHDLERVQQDGAKDWQLQGAKSRAKLGRSVSGGHGVEGARTCRLRTSGGGREERRRVSREMNRDIL